MQFTRRDALTWMALAPVAAVIAHTSARAERSWFDDDPQWVDPPNGLNDEEKKLLALAAESARSMTVSAIVQDSRFEVIHPQPDFRSLVRGMAKEAQNPFKRIRADHRVCRSARATPAAVPMPPRKP